MRTCGGRRGEDVREEGRNRVADVIPRVKTLRSSPERTSERPPTADSCREKGEREQGAEMCYNSVIIHFLL